MPQVAYAPGVSRTKVLTVRLREAELEGVRAAALLEGEPVSVWCRRVLLAEVEAGAEVAPPAEPDVAVTQ